MYHNKDDRDQEGYCLSDVVVSDESMTVKLLRIRKVFKRKGNCKD